MLRNLLLALFLIALAFPAIIMPAPPAQASQTVAQDCHGMPVEPQDSNAQHSESNARLHGCIGCVAPQGPTVAVIEVTSPPFIVQQQIARELSGTAQPPHVPPPRT